MGNTAHREQSTQLVVNSFLQALNSVGNSPPPAAARSRPRGAARFNLRRFRVLMMSLTLNGKYTVPLSDNQEIVAFLVDGDKYSMIGGNSGLTRMIPILSGG